MATADRVRWAASHSWLILAICVFFVAHSNQDQWDFRVFHSAAQALNSGASPYYAAHPNPLMPSGLSYLYPPVALYAFQPLSGLSFDVARLVWLAMKVLALFVLIRLWHRNFEPLDAYWFVFLTMAYNSTLLRDLVAGNISLFEQLGMWFGFYLLLKRRPLLAGVVIAAVAQFKLIPVLFLGTLLFIRPTRSWAPFGVALVAFGAIFSLNFLLTPGSMTEYIHSFATANPNLDERGVVNPSSLALIRDLAAIAVKRGLPVDRTITNAIYAAYIALVGLIFVWIPRKSLVELADKDPRLAIYYFCVLYALIVPRMKDYSYILLLMPSLYVVREVSRGTLKPRLMVPLVGVLMLVQTNTSIVPVLKSALPLISGYMPWIATWFVLYYLAFVCRPRPSAAVAEHAGPEVFAP